MAPPSLDDLLQEKRRLKHLEDLAQNILGSRTRTPSATRQQGALNGSIASRAGVSRRPAAAPRTNSAPAARASRPAPPAASKPRSNRPREAHNDDYYDGPDNSQARASYQPQPQAPQQRPAQTRGNARTSALRPAAGRPVGDANADAFNVRGAAKIEHHEVVAENFAPGTTAADIEAVMRDVGGEMYDCRLVNTAPVIAEMDFATHNGAAVVIGTFDGKKADGLTLHVYWKGRRTTPPRDRTPEPVGFVVDSEPSAVEPGDSMDVDEHTRDREEQNRLREERRGPASRGPANEPQREARDRGGRSGGYPAGPRADRGGYNDQRYGNGGGDRYGGGGRRYDGGGGGGGGRRGFSRGQGYPS